MNEDTFMYSLFTMLVLMLIIPLAILLFSNPLAFLGVVGGIIGTGGFCFGVGYLLSNYEIKIRRKQ